MGAESSHMKSVSISDKELVERLRNDVALFNGKLNTKTTVSVFEDLCSTKENPFAGYTLDRPLARSIRNLKIYRHPYSIIKFLGSTNDKILATEILTGSLEKHLKNQSEIQVCLGLKNILNALIFLVESAKVRHLNISIDSIFITENGTWKLCGMEHCFASSDITKDFLRKSKPYRNQQSISPDEDDDIGLEQYAFASLCESVINENSKIPFVQEFLTYCQTHLKHKNSSMRPLLSAIQLHNYFTHDFVIIHGFLSELALKTQPAKQEFFKNLIEKLKQFDEATIGSQLSELLLSRLVLIDTSAQFYFIPFLLKPQNLEDDEETSVEDGLFSMPGFVKFIVPKLKQVFQVLDVQIRLTLLEHFHLYVNAFTKEELIHEILPQLLLGIKDTNDLLVTKTLYCLAELIPLLGASQVIGKNRSKLFADGRPQQTETWTNDQPRSITPVISSSMDILLSSSPVNNASINNLIEYPTKVTLTEPTRRKEISMSEDVDGIENEEEWSWDNENENENEEEKVEEIPQSNDNEVTIENLIIEEKVTTSTTSQMKEKIVTRPKVNDNIDELDIKNQKLSKLEKSNEVDFFSDFGMSPAMSFNTSTAEVVMDEKSKTETSTNRLQMVLTTAEVDNDDGWGDDDAWNNDDEIL